MQQQSLTVVIPGGNPRKVLGKKLQIRVGTVLRTGNRQLQVS